MRSLSLDSLGPVPTDPSNAVADDPRAAALGQALFFDTRFSANGQVACGTCHQPGRDFTDGLPLAHGVGTTASTTISVVLAMRASSDGSSIQGGRPADARRDLVIRKPPRHRAPWLSSWLQTPAPPRRCP